MPAITVNAFAKRMGVTPYAVWKAMRDGRIKSHRKNEKGIVLIDAVKASDEWARNTDPVAAAKGGKVWPVPGALRESHAEETVGRTLPLPAVDEAPDFMEARASKEDANAKLAHLELQERLGVLVPKADVEKAAFAVARMLRDALLHLPDVMAPRLAAESDWSVIRADLDNELRTALNGLADKLSAPDTVRDR
jgi:hypothetical protein